jgi:hypothetical protein
VNGLVAIAARPPLDRRRPTVGLAAPVTNIIPTYKSLDSLPQL